jgi:hypothetical protein
MRSRLLAAFALVALVVGGILSLAGRGAQADLAWAIGTAVVLASVVPAVIGALARRRIGVDAIALLAMGGALLLDEYLAGAVIALMLAGGERARGSCLGPRSTRVAPPRGTCSANRPGAPRWDGGRGRR